MGLPSALATPLPVHMRPTNTMRAAIRARLRLEFPESLKLTDRSSSNCATCDPRSFKLLISVVMSNSSGGVQHGGRSERRFIYSLPDLGLLNNAILRGAQRGSEDRHPAEALERRSQARGGPPIARLPAKRGVASSMHRKATSEKEERRE